MLQTRTRIWIPVCSVLTFFPFHFFPLISCLLLHGYKFDYWEMNKCFILCAGLSDPFPDLVGPAFNGSGNVCVPMNLRKGTWDSFCHLCFSSVSQSCLTLCNPMNRNTAGLPVHHQLPEFTQTHVHQVSDAIQLSQLLSSPSPPAPNPSQHQGLFQWVNSSHEVAKVLEFQLQHQSFKWKPRTYLLQDGLIGSPCSPGDSQRVFSNTTVHVNPWLFHSNVWQNSLQIKKKKHQFFSAQLSSRSNSHIHTRPLEKPSC